MLLMMSFRVRQRRPVSIELDQRSYKRVSMIGSVYHRASAIKRLDNHTEAMGGERRGIVASPKVPDKTWIDVVEVGLV